MSMQIENMGSRILMVRGATPRQEIKLLPGVNTVSNVLWKLHEQNTGMKAWFACGMLRFAKGDHNPIATPETRPSKAAMKRIAPPASLKEYGAIKAKQRVRQTNDAGLLRQWQADEQRKTVQAVISEQLEEVEAAVKR